MQNNEEHKTVKTDTINDSRRNLLKGFGSIAITGAVVSSAAVASNIKDDSRLEIKGSPSGYHETQHIHDYYNSL